MILMSNKRLLKILVISQWLLLIGASIVGTIEQRSLPQLLRSFQAERASALAAYGWVYFVLGLIYVVAYVTASIAILKNTPWSPPLYVCSVLFGYVLRAFQGALVGTPVSGLLAGLYLICVGGTIGLLYLSRGTPGTVVGQEPGASMPPAEVNAGAAANTADAVPESFIKALLRNIRSGLRATFLLYVDRSSFSASASHLIALVGINLVLSLLMNLLRVGVNGEFNMNYLPYTLFYLPLMIIASSWIAILESRDELRLVIPIALISAGIWIEPAGDLIDLLLNNELSSGITFLFGMGHYYRLFAWWVLASFLIVRRVGGPFRDRRPALVFLFVLALPLWFVPKWGVWTESFQEADTNEDRQTIASEEIFYAQPALLEQKLTELKPGRKGVIDLYFVGFGADAYQDVFMKEIAVVSKLFDERFDTRGRSISLINNNKTVDTVPIATRTALERAVRHIARIMDRDEDVLFLYLTSHGSEQHELSVNFWPLELEEIRPEDIREILDEAGVTWKVIVVSACYSGGYVEPLKDENTLIITSADAKSSSFGCSNDSDFTYFGKAYFDEFLRRYYSFIEPFDEVKRAILKREHDGSDGPSSPQIHAGTAVRKHLQKFEERLRKSGG